MQQRFLSDREEANEGSVFSNGFGLRSSLSSYQWAMMNPLLSWSSSTSTKAKLQTRTSSQLNWKTTITKEWLSVPRPKLCYLQHSSQNLLYQRNRWLRNSRSQWLKERGKKKRWGPFIQALSPRKFTGNHWVHSVYNKNAKYRQSGHLARTAITAWWAWISERKSHLS